MKRLYKQSENNMTIIYAQEEFPKQVTKSIFLAGPTSRENGITQWRLDAIQILKDLNYDGIVFIPELRNGIFNNKYNEQVEWEQKCLNACDCIIMYLDRNYSDGLTSNVEFGKYQNSQKLIVGIPKNSEHNKYIECDCNNIGIDIRDTLDDLIKSAVYFIDEGAYRENGECYVPLNIWNTEMFKLWHESQKKCGNELRYAKVNYVFKMPIMKQIFFWILYVQIYIKSEDRIKDNEFVISRTDISSIVIYKKDKEDILNSDIVLVKEFRSPSNNSKGYIFEVPGGSSFKDNSDINEVIKDEIMEETGLEFNKDRIIYEGSRQLMATLSSHKCHLFSVEINDKELEYIKSQVDSVHGVEEDTERTYLQIYKMKDLLKSDFVDWSNIGYILSILNK